MRPSAANPGPGKSPVRPFSPPDQPLFTYAGLRAFWRHYVTHTDRSLFEELIFRVHARRQQVPRLQTLLLAFGLLVVAIWPTDFLFFQEGRVRTVFGIWRSLTLVAMGLLYWLTSWIDPVRERTIWSLVLGLAGYFALTGFLFGEIRGLSFPWFYIAYMVPMFSIAMALDVLPRVVATLLVPGAYVGTYMLNVPGSLQYPDLHQFLPLTGSSVFLFVVIGHSIYHLDRVNFFQSRTAKRQRARMSHLARHDQLTGLFNRREFTRRFREEYGRARRYNRSFSVMMLDLDHFKRINDVHGHLAGDEVLGAVGELLRGSTRRADIPGRYGGEEFVVVLPETPLEEARQLAERIRRELSDTRFQGENGGSFTVTGSLGVAALLDEDSGHETLLKRVDRALYRAKKEGRDRVVVARRNAA